MTAPSSCLAHPRNSKNTRKAQVPFGPHRPISKKACTRAPPPSSSFLPHSPSQKSSLQKHTTSRHKHTLWVMPPRRTPPTSHPQPILVLHPLSPGRPTPSSRTHRRTRPSRPSSPRKVPPPHPRSRHPLLLRIAPSLRPRSTLPSILPHFTPLAPHTKLRSAESENSSLSPSTRLYLLPRSRTIHLPTSTPIRLCHRPTAFTRPTSPRRHH